MGFYIYTNSYNVDNDILLNRLSVTGFFVPLLRFLSSYHADRGQFERVGNFISKSYFTRSGVSQGSNLGHLLSTILVNDIGRVVKTVRCLLFADDMKVFSVVRDAADCKLLQRDISTVVERSTACGQCSMRANAQW